jgi:hypothetical protein
MRRRLLDLCLLAYPRARRERDRDYLRDLALDLSETHGLRRQALSLLRGGLAERVELGRRPGSSLRPRITRVVLTCSMLAALAFGASAVVGPDAGEGERAEVERLTCVYIDHPSSGRDQVRDDGLGACVETRGMVTERVREGWDCATRRRTRDGLRKIAWRCALGHELVAWRMR